MLVCLVIATTEHADFGEGLRTESVEFESVYEGCHKQRILFGSSNGLNVAIGTASAV